MYFLSLERPCSLFNRDVRKRFLRRGRLLSHHPLDQNRHIAKVCTTSQTTSIAIVATRFLEFLFDTYQILQIQSRRMTNTTTVSSDSPEPPVESPPPLYKEEYRVWFWPVAILVPPIIPIMWNYHVTITEDELNFGYSSVITSKRVRNRKTTIREITPLFDQKWAGWGIHYRPDPTKSFFGAWERLYICKNGGAVKLVLYDDDDEGTNEGGERTTTTFYFSTDDPQKVCDILNKGV